jgi:hypothetical protein
LDGYKLTGMPRQVLREHVQEIYKNNEFISLIVKEAKNSGIDQLDKSKQGDFGKNFGAEIALIYTFKGLSRLSIEEQRTFVKFLVNWMKVATDEDCKKLLVTGGQTSSLQDASLEMKYYFRMEREDLRSYFAIIRNAIAAELNNFPNAKSLNQQQVKIADNALENEFRKKIESGLIDYKTITAMTDLPGATPSMACEAGRQIFSTILGMRGLTGEMALTKFILSMQ